MCARTRCLIEFLYWPVSKREPAPLASLTLPFAQEKAHPLATLHSLSLDVLTPFYLSFIKTFQAPKSFCNFFRPPPP